MTTDPPVTSPDELASLRNELRLLRENEERFRLMVECSIEVFFFQLGPDRRATYVSPSVLNVTGYTPEEVLGKTVPDFLVNGLAIIPSPRKPAAPSGNDNREPYFVEGRHKNGSTIALEVLETHFFDESGDRTIRGFARDVTARRIAENKLELSDQILNRINALVLVVNGKGQVIYVNPSATRTLGYTAAEMLGYGWWQYQGGTPETRKELREYIAALARGEHPLREEIVKITYDNQGHPHWLLWQETKGPGDLLIGIAQDITDRKRLEQQFMQAQKMEALGRLAGGVAHDVNNMLMAIRGYGELLQHKLAENPASNYIDHILSAVDRAALTTRQLLAFSRQQVVQPQKLSLNSVVIEMGKLLQRTIGEDIQLQLSLAADLGEIVADPGELGQVLLNLAINAKDAMPDGGLLHIETSNVTLDSNYSRKHLNVKPGEYVLLSVTDTGCGMDPATAARIFEPFFTTKAPGKGTGLGLPTTYGIVKQAGGAIYVYSEPGEGTSFKVYLPRTDIPSNPLTHLEVNSGEKNLTVLVLDDDVAAADVLAAYLTNSGYRVLKATSGREAVRLCRSHSGPIDIFISDLTMPGTDGQDLCGLLALEHPEIKSLYISGFSRETLLDRNVLPADAAFLQKPFRFADLDSMLQQLLTAEPPGLPEPASFS